jgi:hypothetical protein
MIFIWLRNWWDRRKRMREAIAIIREEERIHGARYWEDPDFLKGRGR